MTVWIRKTWCSCCTEHFLAWYQSVDQMYKSIPGGFDTVPANIVVHMLKGSIRLPEDKGKVELMNTQRQVMEYMNGKYLGGKHVVMNKLPYPNKFSTAISNCERVMECVIMITTVGFDNKINEQHVHGKKLHGQSRTKYHERI